MTTFSSQVILSIFFLYVVIVSEKLFSLISCNFQKLIENSRNFKHLFIIVNIFLFTFILGWYTENSIYSAKDVYSKYENFDSKINEENYSLLDLYKPEIKIIVKYILYSFVIYVIFLLTTKCEILYLKIFFGLIVIMFFLFLLRTYSKNQYYNSNDFKLIDYIDSNEKTYKLNLLQKNLENANLSNNKKKEVVLKFKINMNIQNIEFFLFIISLIALFIGFIFYFIRQRKQHTKDWNYVTFILGKNICNSLK